MLRSIGQCLTIWFKRRRRFFAFTSFASMNLFPKKKRKFFPYSPFLVLLLLLFVIYVAMLNWKIFVCVTLCFIIFWWWRSLLHKLQSMRSHSCMFTLFIHTFFNWIDEPIHWIVNWTQISIEIVNSLFVFQARFDFFYFWSSIVSLCWHSLCVCGLNLLVQVHCFKVMEEMG